VDDDEQALIDERGIPVLPADRLTGTALAEAVAATGAETVYVHIDLDVLDPGIVAGVAEAQPFGVGLPELIAELRALVARFPLVGAGITMFSPESADAAEEDLPAILRLLSALTAA
jgi:arginase